MRNLNEAEAAYRAAGLNDPQVFAELRTLRETMTQAKTDGANTTQQQLAQMKQAIRAARAECERSLLAARLGHERSQETRR